MSEREVSDTYKLIQLWKWYWSLWPWPLSNLAAPDPDRMTMPPKKPGPYSSYWTRYEYDRWKKNHPEKRA